MDEWIRCEDEMPPEHEGHSEDVKCLLDNGKTETDFTINGKWVWHCRLDSTGGYPVAWRKNDEVST